MCTWFERVVVVRRRLEDQTLILVAILDVEQLRFERVVVAHLVAGDVVKPALAVGVAVVSVLVAVACGFHPERAVCMKKFNVRTLSIAPPPLTVFLTISTYRHHGNGMSVCS